MLEGKKVEGERWRTYAEVCVCYSQWFLLIFYSYVTTVCIHHGHTSERQRL